MSGHAEIILEEGKISVASVQRPKLALFKDALTTSCWIPNIRHALGFPGECCAFES